jgi:hypothetical protein
MNNYLYVIIPFFSFGNIDLRLKNLKKCLQYLLTFQEIKVIFVEATYGEQPEIRRNFQLDSRIIHLTYELESIFWVKENLINLAIENLPNDWEYVAWIDSDIIFSNLNWVKETLNKLKSFDIVQLFEFVIYLNNRNVFDKSFQSILPSIAYQSLLGKNNYGSIGFGWAITRNFYNIINKFYEYNITGGGDTIFVHSVIRHKNKCLEKEKTFTEPYSLNYKYSLDEYMNRFPKNLKFGCISGMIFHLWHGDLSNRKYHIRKKILHEHSFDPYRDLTITSNGLLSLRNKNIEEGLISYFKERGD